MGYVYLLGDSGQKNLYKIGVTKGKIEKRIKQLQTGNSNEIYLVNFFETKYPFYMERILHSKYQLSKVKNEWFFLSDKDVNDFISSCTLIEENTKAIKDNPFVKKILK